MAKRAFPFRCEDNVLTEIEKIASRRKKSMNDIMNEACLQYVQRDGQQDIDSIYSPIMERMMLQHLKSFENRFAALMAKNALDSAMSMFLLIDSISKSKKIEPEELYQNVRKMAVKHVQQRDELMEMVRENMKG